MNNIRRNNLVGATVWRGFVFGLIPIVFFSCRPPAQNDEQQIGQKLDSCYHSYLTSNKEQARTNLFEYLKIVPEIKSPHGQAYNYLFAYSRLYALEAKVGNVDLSEVYYIKAKYWRIIECESGNMSESDIIDIAKSMNTNQCLLLVDNWDRSHNHGQDPRYNSLK